jgi:Fe-S oxidoreductase
VLAVELVAELVRGGRLTLNQPVERVVTYHDPCRLNKRKGVHAAPRELLRAIPGVTFHDVDHVTQWSYCSGAGGGLQIEKPELTAEISRRRVARAAELEVDTLISACPWSERPLATAGAEKGIAVMDLFELVAQAAGIEVGGSTGASAPVLPERAR